MSATGVVGFLGFILKGLRSTGSTLFKLPFLLPFILVWLLGVLYFLFNAQSLFGENAFQQSIILLMYIASLALAFAMSGVRNPLSSISTAEFFITFGLWAAIGAVVFKAFAPFSTDRALLTTESVSLLLTHALVVAVGEELLFRVVIPEIARRFKGIPPMAAMTLSAFAFGVMHFTAYGGNWHNILFASGLGLLFGAITLRFKNGLIIAIALHFIFNAYVLGFV